MQKIDFESQNFAIFNNFYASKTQKNFIGQCSGLAFNLKEGPAL